MRVRILSGHQAGQVLDLPFAEAVNAFDTGYATPAAETEGVPEDVTSDALVHALEGVQGRDLEGKITLVEPAVTPVDVPVAPPVGDADPSGTDAPPVQLEVPPVQLDVPPAPPEVPVDASPALAEPPLAETPAAPAASEPQ
jgi:hypothetical protein